MILVQHSADNFEQFNIAAQQNISNKLTLVEAASLSAANSATSAQQMSSQASLSAMNALTYKNQAMVALGECQDILQQLLQPSGPISTAQNNATQAQQSAQSALQDKVATNDLRNEVEAWHSAIQSFLTQATNARNTSVASANAAAGSASGASSSANQASDSAAAAAVSAGQAAGSAAAALAHSLNYIPGPQGPAGQNGLPGNTPFTLHGEYNNGVTYMAGDAVTFQGSLYRLNAFIGAAGYNPVAYPNYWAVIAAGGAKGDKGDPGTPGLPGATGAAGASDKYKTTSTSTLTVNNTNAQTLTIETGLSWTVGQNCVIAYDANNHMHGTVVSYNPTTGVMVFDSDHHTGSGTYSTWTVNLDGPIANAPAGIQDAPSDNWTYERFNGTWRRVTYIPLAGTLLSEGWTYFDSTDASGSTYYSIGQYGRWYADGNGGSNPIYDAPQYPNGYKTSWNPGQPGQISWSFNTQMGDFTWGVRTNYEEYQNGSVVSGSIVEQDYYSAGYQFASIDMNGYYRHLIYDGSGNWHYEDVYPSDPYGTKYGTPVWRNPSDTSQTGGFQNVADGNGGSVWISWDGQAPYPPDGTDWGSYTQTSELYWQVNNSGGTQMANGYFTYASYGETIVWSGTSFNSTMFSWYAAQNEYITSGNFYDENDMMWKNYYVSFDGSGSYNVSYSY
jgi:hypothetical protein